MNNTLDPARKELVERLLEHAKYSSDPRFQDDLREAASALSAEDGFVRVPVDLLDAIDELLDFRPYPSSAWATRHDQIKICKRLAAAPQEKEPK